MRTPSALCAMAVMLAATSAYAAPMTLLGTYSTGIYDDGASEIPAFDPASKQLFVVNGALGRVDVVNIANPYAPSAAGLLPLNASLGYTPNSVAVKNGIVAIASGNAANETLPGVVDFYSTAGVYLNTVTVGVLPDMLTFTPDGTKVLVANEGQPSGYGPGFTDPEGSVSIINLANGVAAASVTPVSFAPFNNQRAALQATGVRLLTIPLSDNVTKVTPDVANDLEPEYIAISPDGTKAFVTLQENNALAVIDIPTATVTSIKGFGLKDHSLPQNALDTSDRDVAGGAGINIRHFPNVPLFGMYQPDAIATFQANGNTFLITANEGDARDYDGMLNAEDDNRVGSLSLDPTAFGGAANVTSLKNNANLGRLRVSNLSGDTDGDGDFDQLHAFGARSFTIWDQNGNLLWDSGKAIEEKIAQLLPNVFNASNTNNSLDSRSVSKGPEPEGLAIGNIDGRTYAFVGLERIGGVMMWDITDPNNVAYVDYINNRDFAHLPGIDHDNDPNTPLVANPLALDSGPEGLVFVSAADSPIGVPLLIVGNEVTGTTSIYAIPEPTSLGILAVGALGLLRRRR